MSRRSSPKFVVFLIILIVGYLIAKAIAKILSKVLTRVGFAYLPLVFVAIIIIVIAAAIAAAAKRLIEGSLGGLSYGKTLANLAAGFIVAIGIIAALDQLKIAPNVVNAILYAALAALVG